MKGNRTLEVRLELAVGSAVVGVPAIIGVDPRVADIAQSAAHEEFPHVDEVRRSLRAHGRSALLAREWALAARWLSSAGHLEQLTTLSPNAVQLFMPMMGVLHRPSSRALTRGAPRSSARASGLMPAIISSIIGKLCWLFIT